MLVTALSANGATLAVASEPLQIEAVLLELIDQADVPGRDPGVIREVFVKEGDLVAKGDRLLQLDTQEADLDVTRARLEWSLAQQESKNDVDVRFARKSLEVSEAELQRALDSVEDYPKSISATELDRLKLTVERTRLEIEQAEHNMAMAKLTADLKQNEYETSQNKLNRQTIQAPIAGVVAQVYRHTGEWVEPGQQVVRILRLDRLRVEGFVSVEQLDSFPVGSPIELHLALRKQVPETFSGHLVHVSPEVDPVNGQVRVWADVENADMRLKPGMRGTMVIVPADTPGLDAEMSSSAEPDKGPTGSAKDEPEN